LPNNLCISKRRESRNKERRKVEKSTLEGEESCAHPPNQLMLNLEEPTWNGGRKKKKRGKGRRRAHRLLKSSPICGCRTTARERKKKERGNKNTAVHAPRWRPLIFAQSEARYRDASAWWEGKRRRREEGKMSSLASTATSAFPDYCVLKGGRRRRKSAA